MSNKGVATHKDHGKVGKIIDALMNPLTTAQRTTLAGTLGSTNKGLLVWDTDLSALYGWNGSAFVTPTGTQSGLTPKGSIAFNGTEPTSPVVGDLYVFSSAGTNTWNTSDVVQIGDQAWWDGTNWQFIQGNVIAATETIPGIIEIATQAETNTGTDDVRAITPAKLTSWANTKAFGKVFFASGLTLVVDTPLTINHALNLQNRDAFIASFKVGNSEEEIDIDSTDANNMTLTSNRAITGGSILIVGY